jgi:hypothetical protein
MFLQLKDETSRSAREKQLLAMMERQSIEYFPVGKALALPQSEQNEDVEDLVSGICLRLSSLKLCFPADCKS